LRVVNVPPNYASLWDHGAGEKTICAMPLCRKNTVAPGVMQGLKEAITAVRQDAQLTKEGWPKPVAPSNRKNT